MARVRELAAQALDSRSDRQSDLKGEEEEEEEGEVALKLMLQNNSGQTYSFTF